MQIKNQTVNKTALWWLCGILAGCPGSILAEELSPEWPVALELLVEADEGRWRLVAIETLRQAPPGRLLMVSVLFRVPVQAGPEPQMLNLAVPDSLDYQMGSAVGPGSQVQLSFNKGLSFSVDPGPGKSSEYAGARASHVRWVFTRRLSAGAQGQVRYRAIRRPNSGNGEAVGAVEHGAVQQDNMN